MKKRILLIFVLFAFVMSLNLVVAEEEESEFEGPGLLYDFYYEWDDSWNYVPATWSGSMCDIEYSDNALLINIHGKDPYIFLEVYEEIELEEYPWIKVRIKNESATSETFEMYVIRDNEQISETNNFHYNIGKEHEEFMEFIIDARVVKSEQWWTGALTGLRFDAVRNAAEEGGETFYLEYLGFFKTQEDAENFEPVRDATPPPTKEPTDTPAQTPKPTNTQKPASTPKQYNSDKGGTMTLGIILSVVIILAAVVVAVIIVRKSRK